MTDRIIVGSDGRKYITNEPAQPEKPIAFFEFQDRGFYWAPDTAIGPVPVARKVDPMPLYSNQQAQPERAGLTDGRIQELYQSVYFNGATGRVNDFVRAIEQAHGIKQGGAA